MELKELCEKTLALFEINSVDGLSDALMNACMNYDIEKFEAFADMVEDLSVDWLQKIFQYYEADRKTKMQDYTPKTLAALIGRLVESDDEKSVYDMCAGSGALTIQKWNQNPTLNFTCIELDMNAIPYLLFNMALRNMNGEVLQGDVLQGEIAEKYNLRSGERFSTIAKMEPMFYCQCCDSCISNPPYNMKWQIPPFAGIFEEYCDYGVPPERNANYAFILQALKRCDHRTALILPNNVLTTDDKQEKPIRQRLIESGVIEAVIMCPDGMFESTSIPTCVFVLNKHKESNMIEFVDMRQTYETEIREQNGQYGGASHERRTYKKEIKVFSDDQIQMIVDLIRNHSSVEGLAQPATVEAVKNNDYILTASRYIEAPENNLQHRDYGDIIDDLNHIISEKNAVKLTMNESLAKALDMYEVFLMFKQSEGLSEAMNKSLSFTGKNIEKENFIQMSKNACELKLENKSKDSVSTILLSILPTWKQHIMYLNNEENRYLAELRDALLPDLMSGKLEVSDET